MRFMPYALLAGLVLSTAGVHAQFAPMTPDTTICNAGECRSVKTVNPDVLREQILLMFKTNSGRKMTVCNGGDSCMDSGLSVPVQIQGENRALTLSNATITDVAKDADTSQIKLIFSYEARLNSFILPCQSASARLDMTNPEQMTLNTNGFSCALTDTEKAVVTLTFNIDYIQLEQGVLAGSYTITVSGGAIGQTGGHAVLQLEKKTPVTLDKNSIGLRQPDKEALLEQARAEIQAKQQQVAFDEIQAQQPSQEELTQFLMQTGGQDGLYMAPQQVVWQPVVYAEPTPVDTVYPQQLIYIAQ